MKIKIIKISFFAVLLFAVVFNACEKLSQHYEIKQAKCTSCMECVAVCGYGAIRVDSLFRTTSDESEYATTIRIDPAKCVGCGEGFKRCPYEAINLVVDDDYEDGHSGATRLR